MADNESPQLQNLSLADAAPTCHPTESAAIQTASSTVESGSGAIRSHVSFLELPPEVLKLICKHAFSCFVEGSDIYDEQSGKYTTLKLKVAFPTYDLGDRSKNPENAFRMPWYSCLSAAYPHLGLPKNTLALLGVCTRLYETGAPIFYELYTFRSTSAESFRLFFTKHIGPTNLRAIRKLMLGLPYGIKTMPSKYIGRYTRMLDNQMPQLQELTITTKFGRWYWPVTLNPANTWIENHRGLLWFAAWVTRSHPSLKCAVWDEKNTVFSNKLDDERWHQFDDRPDVELSVKISAVKPKNVQVMTPPREIETRNAELEDLYGEPQVDESDSLYYDGINPDTGLAYEAHPVPPATRILLDSWKIRRTGFVGLSTLASCRPYAYQLPPTAKDSEARRPVESDLHGEVWLEEIFLHNKKAEAVIANLHEAKSNTHTLSLRARALENKNIEEEMFMKRGPPPVMQGDSLEEADGGNDHDGGDNADDDNGGGDNGYNDNDGWGGGTWTDNSDNANDDNGWGGD